MAMDVREKIVELLKSVLPNFRNNMAYWGEKPIYEFADCLLANGVTLPEWISVDDKLPEFCVSVLARCFHQGKWRTLVCHMSKENAGEWYTDEVCQWVKVTHWMPPPELPKGE